LNNTFSVTPEKLLHPTPLDKYLVNMLWLLLCHCCY